MASNFTRSSRGLFTGLFIIAIGLIFLLDQEGIVSADYMFRFFWPAIFIFFGLEAAFCRESGNRRIFGIVMTAIGVLLLVSKFGFLHIHIGFELIWPVALIWAGVWTIVHAFQDGRRAGTVSWLVRPISRSHASGRRGPFGIAVRSRGCLWRRQEAHHVAELQRWQRDDVLRRLSHRSDASKHRR